MSKSEASDAVPRKSTPLPGSPARSLAIKLSPATVASLGLMDDAELRDTNGTPLLKWKSNDYRIGALTFVVYTPVVQASIGDGIIAKSRKGKFYMATDDNTFEHYPELQRLFPRGASWIVCSGPGIGGAPKSETGHVAFRIQGLPKFTGRNPIDEDLDDYSKAKELAAKCTALFNEDLVRQALQEDNLYTLETEKANGKMTVMTVVQLNGLYYIIGGSKTVHIVHALKDPVSAGHEKSLAHCMVASFRKQLLALADEKRITLVEHLQNGHRSLVGEYLDGLHLVPLDEREEPYIRWFAISGDRNAASASSSTSDSSLCDNIYGSLSLLSSIGLPTVIHTLARRTKASPDIDRQKLREGENKEGVVVHWLRKDGEKYVTIAIEKFKTTWYIILRMLRQLALKKNFLRGERAAYSDRIKKTLQKRSDDFLHLSDHEFDYWLTLCVDFCDWVKASNIDAAAFDVIERDASIGGVGMGALWRRFTAARLANGGSKSVSSVAVSLTHGDSKKECAASSASSNNSGSAS